MSERKRPRWLPDGQIAAVLACILAALIIAGVLVWVLGASDPAVQPSSPQPAPSLIRGTAGPGPVGG